MEALVRLLLQGGEVVELLRGLALLPGLELGYPGRTSFERRKQSLGLRRLVEPILVPAEPLSFISAGGVEEGRLENKEVLRDEILDLELAIHQEGEGRGHHPADGPGSLFLATEAAGPEGHGPAAGHADQPIGHRSAIGCVAKALIAVPGFHVGVGLADGFLGEALGPEAEGLGLALGLVDDQAGDQLAFPPGVGGDHDFGGLGQLGLDDVELVLGLGDHLVFERLGDHRQDVPGPLLPGRIIFLRCNGLHQVADGPGADGRLALGVGTFYIALSLGPKAQRLGDGGPHGRLFGKDYTQIGHVFTPPSV